MGKFNSLEDKVVVIAGGAKASCCNVSRYLSRKVDTNFVQRIFND